MVTAKRIHIAVIEPAPSQSEDEQDRCPVLQQTGQGRRGRRLLRVGSVRSDDWLSQLRREAPLRKPKCLKATTLRQLPEVQPGLADTRRARHPAGDLLWSDQAFFEWEAERRKVPVERKGDRCRSGDCPSMCLGESGSVVRVVQADCHPPAGHREDDVATHLELGVLAERLDLASPGTRKVSMARIFADARGSKKTPRRACAVVVH